MPDDRVAPLDPPGLPGGLDPASKEFAELRELLVGPERRKLTELERRLDASALDPEELAERLPEAIALRAGRDRQLARALAPTVERAISESVRRNPQEIATAIFPVLGPAIRKAIAETMAALVKSINAALEHSLSVQGLKWRLESWRTGVPYAQIVIRHALVYRVEQVFLIHTQTGLLLAHVAPPELEVADADLISGMLTAIQDFVADSFKQEAGGKLRTFSVGELTVLVEQGPQAAIAAVVRGQAPDSLIERLQATLEGLHFQLARQFAEFHGDAVPFDAARPTLETCLETVVSTERTGQPSRTAWLYWAVPIGLVLIVWGGFTIRAERRWKRAVARFRAEPGIVLVQAERNGGMWLFSGLRDPLAPEPTSLIDRTEHDPSKVGTDFRPFLSLDPKLVLERARQALAVPSGTAAALRADSLVFQGKAPVDWLARVAALSILPPGLSRLDLSRAEPALPAPFAPVASGIEERRILFAIGSAEVTQPVRNDIAGVAGDFLRILAGTPAPGYRIELELVGRADTTGSDAANQALSQWRVEAVRHQLVALGIPAEAIRGTAVATSNPLPGRDEADRARINRSVSLTVHVGPDNHGGKRSR